MRNRRNIAEISGVQAELSPVFFGYWKFAAERQRIFFRRMLGSNSPALTDDSVLRLFKFTNAYRASDRVSQYLIKDVIYGGYEHSSDEDLFFRIILFKLFNKIETWKLLERELGEVSLKTYSYAAFDRVLTRALESGERIYSAAYIMPSAGRVFGQRYKHQNHLKLVEFMLAERFPSRVAQTTKMSDAFELMVSAPSIGPFLAYQFVTDLNYSPLTSFSEMEFVIPGPGALDGISKCFANSRNLDPVAVIEYMAANQDEWFDRLDIEFPSLWGRPLQLIDCQNLFCEISKYARAAFPEVQGVAGRTRIKQKFAPSGRPPRPWYPPDWGINDAVHMSCSHTLPTSEQANAVQYTLL